MLTDEKTVPVARSNLSKHMGSEPNLVAPVWSGLLREFRNHLASLVAATAEVTAMTPSSALPDIAPALQKTALNPQRMNARATLLAAAVGGGAPATVDLDK